MDSASLVHYTTELIYNLFGLVFFAFFFVTLVAFRRPLITYCAASYIVASILWVMTTIFNLGYMLPHLFWSVCRLQHPDLARSLLGNEAVELTPQQQQAAMMMLVPKSLLSLRARLGGVISPPIVNEDLLIGAEATPAAASFKYHGSEMGQGSFDIVSSGVAGCLAIMVLVCLCSALLVAVSVGMVLEANILEQQESEKTRNIGGVASPVMVADALRVSRMPGSAGESARQHPRVLRLAMWVNKFVGIDELRYTSMYPSTREGILASEPAIRGNLLFFMPRACTRLFLGPSTEVIWARPARNGAVDEEAAMAQRLVGEEKR